MGNEGDEPGEPEEEKSFADLFSDAKPLKEGPRRAKRPRAPEVPRPGSGEPIPFERNDRGAEVQALAPGIDREHLKRLRAGKYPVEADLDLHGLKAEEARLEVRVLVANGWEEGLRCLLIIHGVGRHSEGEPVLKSSLPGWLSQAGTGDKILAFCSARPEDGGTGATYVLLRRCREA